MTLKICVVGPKGTCKTAISNFLAKQCDHIANGRHEPTAGASTMFQFLMYRYSLTSHLCIVCAGVRILECEVPIGSSNVPVEVWDASGDQM